MAMTLPTLPPHPAVFLSSTEELASYMRARGLSYFVQPYGFSISIDIGEIADFEIDVFWLVHQLRFIAPSPLDLSTTTQAEAALAVQRVNAEIGFPVWRLLPWLSATDTATLDHNGALSSRIFEYAHALLRDALVRDQRVFREQLGVGMP